MTRPTLRLLALTASLLPVLASAQPDYARAERMLTWNTAPLLVNDITSVTWLGDSTRFWYRVTRPTGFEFVLVDPVAGTQQPLFDHLRLASALTRMDAGRKSYEPSKLPFQAVTFLNGDRTLRFKSGDRWIECVSPRATNARRRRGSHARPPRCRRRIRSGWRTCATTTCG